jgi:hypothetical protein
VGELFCQRTSGSSYKLHLLQGRWGLPESWLGMARQDGQRRPPHLEATLFTSPPEEVSDLWMQKPCWRNRED